MATIPTPHGGILIVCLPEQGASGVLRSHYFDRTQPHGKIRDALAQWMQIWGIGLKTNGITEDCLEANIQEVVWCDEAPKNLHGPQTVKFYASCAERVLAAIDAQRPQILLVLSGYLYEALAAPEVAPRVNALLGKAKSLPRRITQARLKALEQEFEHARILVLPTPSKNTTAAYIETLTAPVRNAITAAGFTLTEAPDELISAAKKLLIVDEKKTLQKWQRQFAIDEARAKRIFEALREEEIITGPDDKGSFFFRN